MGLMIQEHESPAAAERIEAGINQHTEPCGNLPEGSNGRTRDKVGGAIGMSGKTLEAGDG
jgi:ParB family chromosome partitioning protein